MQKFYIQFLAELSYACRLAAEGQYDLAKGALRDALAASALISETVALTHESVLDVLDTWKLITLLTMVIENAEAASSPIKVAFA